MKCMIVRMKIISKNDICLTVAQNYSAAHTRTNPKRSISQGGIVTLIVELGNKWLDKSKESLEQLPANLAQEVRCLIGEEAGKAIKRAKESMVPITLPTATP